MSEGTLKTLTVVIDGAVATVTLSRTEALNALNALMFDELEQVFGELASSEQIRVILVTGAGERAFAAGADIRGLLDTDAVSGRAVSVRGQGVFSQIENCGKPVLAVINGVALGGGCELALACTLRIASDKAKLGLPEAKLGLIPGYGGTQRLHRLIGKGAALRLMLTARVVDAAEALRLGLVDEVVAAQGLLEHATKLAQDIASLAPLAIRGILEATAKSDEQTLDEGLRNEADIFGRLCATQDKHEGLTAFLEKRVAEWQNS